MPVSTNCASICPAPAALAAGSSVTPSQPSPAQIRKYQRTHGIQTYRIVESLGKLGRQGMIGLADRVAAYAEGMRCAAP